MCPAFSFLKKLLRIEPAVKLDHLRDQAGPAGLMVGTEAGRRCLRGNTRRIEDNRANADPTETCPFRRTPHACPSRKKMLVRRFAISLLTSKKFIIRPESVGHQS
jgi:hypothetical protein